MQWNFNQICKKCLSVHTSQKHIISEIIGASLHNCVLPWWLRWRRRSEMCEEDQPAPSLATNWRRMPLRCVEFLVLIVEKISLSAARGAEEGPAASFALGCSSSSSRCEPHHSTYIHTWFPRTQRANCVTVLCWLTLLSSAAPSLALRSHDHMQCILSKQIYICTLKCLSEHHPG